MIRQQQQYKQNQNQHGQGQGQPQHPEGHSQGQGPGQGTQRPTNQNQMQHDAGPSKVQTQTYEDNRQMQQQKKYSISMQQQQQQQNQNQHQSSFTNYQQHQANQMQQQQHQKQMQQPQKHQQRQQQQKQKQASMQTHNRQRPASVSTKQTSGGSASTDMSQSKTATTPLPSSFPIHPQTLSVESPLPPLVQRALGDRSYEKRKNAALEVEALVKSLAESASASNSTTSDSHKMISSLIHILSKDFCPSMNVHFRKGGLIGLAATAIGLNPQQLTSAYLEFLIKPVLICFDDPEPRVRYYACESLYNVVKVARESVLPYFNIIFEGVATVLADTDDEVRDGASLLDRLVKDIVTESEAFSVEKFLPLLQNYIRRTNPYLRQLVVGWITVLDGIPDVCMLDYLPDFLDGLFNMLSDSNLEIRQAADSALSDFLREIRESAVVEFGPIVSILVFQCESKERLNRLTSITWLSELIHHPDSGGDALLPYHADVLGAILHCISDQEVEIRKVSERSNSDLLTFVRDTDRDFELRILLETLTKELTGKDDVPTKMAVLKWINMLLEKRRRDMDEYISKLMPALFNLLRHQRDGVVLLTVQVLSRISLSEVVIQGSASKEKVRDEDQFEMVIKSILELFKADRRLLETRSSLIVRRLCVLLNAKSVYLVMADIISSYDLSPESGDSNTLEFVATMVQTLNLILLTASELNNLRQLLEESFSGEAPEISSSSSISKASAGRYQAKNEGARVFAALFHCWSNNPVSTFSLCLLARAYDLAFALVKKFSELEVTVGLLMQLDRLIGLIESPIFVHIRLQLLDVEAPFHTYLLKSCYGLLMLLPQSDAYRSLNDRLTSVCNLRDNLGVRPSITAAPSTGVIKNEESSIYNAGLDAVDLLDRFDEVMAIHRKARSAIQQKSIMHQQQDHINERNSTVGNVLRVAIVNTPSSRPPDQMPIGMGPSMRQR
jgi:vacuole morphology and inheritance protein 14